jgi:CubicO group peptidase (beta-lactamase class C family)
VCYKPETKATRGRFTHQSTNPLLPADLAHQDEQFYRAFFLLGCAIDQHIFPGATAAITHRGKLIALKAIGRFTYELDSPRVKPETIFDLASLTKIVATTPASMLLFERGKLALEQPLVDVLPEFASADLRRRNVTFRMLLAHSAGLPAYIKLFQTAGNKQELIRQALQVPLVHDPGTQAEYSDIGFILLGEALERITGEPLDRFCDREIYTPLGLGHTRYLPPTDWKSLVPPTEQNQPQRPRVIQGEVNDENCFVIGGVAGHAGVFSTALDVSIYGQCLLNKSSLNGPHSRAGFAREWAASPLFRPETVEIFTRREDFPPGTSRALGWDTPSRPSSSGQYFSERSYGHLGYTGTSLWIDPERRLSVTLLTNRTWPDRSAEGIKNLRPIFHDAVVEALT